MDLINADQNATGFFYMALVFCLESEKKNVQIYYEIDPETLKDFHPPWLTTKKPIGYYVDNALEEKEKQEETVEKYKKDFLENSFSDITIICAKADADSHTMLIDGSHRSIAILRAIKENPSIVSKIRVRCILLTGEKIKEFGEYNHIIE